jgi:hypothetical protein
MSMAFATAVDTDPAPSWQTGLTAVVLVALRSTHRDLIEFEYRQRVVAAMTEDYREAVDSYLNKRAPRYFNR